MSIKKIIISKNNIRWEVTPRLPGDKSKRIRRRFKRKIDAEKFLKSLEDRKNSLFTNDDKDIGDVESKNFNSEADYWLENKGPYFTRGYFRVINPALKRLRKAHGSTKISKFTPALLVEYRISLMKEGLSSSTQNRYLDILTRVINFSYTQRRINVNPCVGYEKVRESTGGIDFWCEDETRLFLDFANKKYPIGSEKRWVFCVYLFCIETGLRANEIWGIFCDDIPINDSKLRIKRQSLGNGEFSPTKGKDYRFVPFSTKLNGEVKSLPQFIKRKSKTLFTSSVGTAVHHDNFVKRTFKKDLVESEVRAIRFHDLRHTALTLMAGRNVNPFTIQIIAGHKNIKTTMNYIHLVGTDVRNVGSDMSFT